MRFQKTEEFRPFVNEPWCILLQRDFNVRHVEQFAGLMAGPDGEVGLRRLGVPVDELREPTERFLRREWDISLSNPSETSERRQNGSFKLINPVLPSFGTIATDDPFRGITFNSPLPPPDRYIGQKPSAQGYFDDLSTENPPEAFVLGSGKLPSVRDQKHRGTCVAFTVCAMWQLVNKFQGNKSRELSPQFAFYWAKKQDDKERQDGTSLAVMMSVFEDIGCCEDEFCPYKGYHDFGQSYMFHDEEVYDKEKVKRNASRQRIKSVVRLATANADAIRRCLASGRAVGLCLPVFRKAWLDGNSYLRGEIIMPLTYSDPNGQDRIQDTRVGNHAVCVCGYRDNTVIEEDSHRPGGGYFVFRNSWGEQWSQAPKERRVEPGYGILPYSYVEKYGLDAYTFESLRIDGKVRNHPSHMVLAAKSAPPSKKRRKR